MSTKILLILFLGTPLNIWAGPSTVDWDELWDYARPELSEKRFRAKLAETQNSGDQELRLQLLTQVARSQGLQKKFEEAHQTLNLVNLGLSASTPVAEIRYFLERGRVYNSSQRSELARPFFVKALELSSTLNQASFAIDALHMLAILEPDPDLQLAWSLKALALAESSSDPKARHWLGALYNNIGWTYHDKAQYKDALTLFKKGLAFREAQGEPNAIRIAKWCVARTQRSLKQYDSALAIQLALAQEFDDLPEKDGYVFEELGEIYLALAQSELARKYFSLAYDELVDDLASEPSRLDRIRRLANRP